MWRVVRLRSETVLFLLFFSISLTLSLVTILWGGFFRAGCVVGAHDGRWFVESRRFIAMERILRDSMPRVPDRCV